MHEVSYLLGGWGCLAGLAGGAMGRAMQAWGGGRELGWLARAAHTEASGGNRLRR